MPSAASSERPARRAAASSLHPVHEDLGFGLREEATKKRKIQGTELEYPSKPLLTSPSSADQYGWAPRLGRLKEIALRIYRHLSEVHRSSYPEVGPEVCPAAYSKNGYAAEHDV